jgi:Tol biopolymer transport system component
MFRSFEEEAEMSKLHRFAVALSLVSLASFTTAAPGEGAEVASCTKNADCDDDNPCTKDKCDQGAGQCEFKPHDQGNHFGQPIACDDGNACTSGDVCHAGACAGVDVPDGSACSDGNACTRSDACQAGACTGASPVVCAASDQCHEAGTCDPATGSCSDPAAPDGTACDDVVTCSGQDTCQAGVCTVPGAQVQKIAFASTRHNPTGIPQVNSGEIYLMDPDGANVARLTMNAFSDAFPALSPDGKGRIVFDSNRNNDPDDPVNFPVNLVDLFLMKSDGSNPQYLGRGTSASWSPDSRRITFQRSASGTGLPIHGLPGAPALDSDIFVASVCDLLAGVPPTNITNDEAKIDVDPDWSSDGQKIVFTNYDVDDDPQTPTSSEIWTMNPDGSDPVQLTHNAVDERGPAWSPDGTRIVYACKQGTVAPNFDLEVCIMNADGTGQTQLTFNTLNDAAPKFSPDGRKIVWNRASGGGAGNHIWVMNTDGSGQTQITVPPTGTNLFPDWGFVTQ